jgi:signal peptidase I
MAKSSKTPKPRGTTKPASKPPAIVGPSPSTAHAIRETVESIVIAFVLAFLFRTFEAEAFVIPTGSMAPTLMGRHKDVYCPKCGHRFTVSASEEESEDLDAVRTEIITLERRLQALRSDPISNRAAIQQIQRALEIDYNRVPPGADVLGGVCPVCRYTMPMRPDFPDSLPKDVAPGSVVDEPSYNGDRILVNKYIYTVSDPQRWDVVVFKFPGNAEVNYIKRLVGRPGEHLRIYQGDLFIGSDGATQPSDFKIARKPPDKILAMRQLVHDTNYDPSELYKAGFPLRWKSDKPEADGGWKADTKPDARDLDERYAVEAKGDEPTWLRYHHVIPDYDIWHELADLEAHAQGQSKQVEFSDAERATFRPQLITDFNAYNTRITRGQAMQSQELRVSPDKLGVHWVGDLMIEADVDVAASEGQLLLDLVKGGKHFGCAIDLTTGKAKMSIDGVPDFSPTADTNVSAPGRYRLALSNFDEQLLLWVNGSVVPFAGGTEYDAEKVFGDRQSILPKTSEADPGDLAPAGIGAKGAKLTVSRLQMWRDIYYIADSWQDLQRSNLNLITDLEGVDPRTIFAMPRDPGLWDLYSKRRSEDFSLAANQYFVMGDNSPESSDARLWCGGGNPSRGRPGGSYLERQLLIGKALCVYWPHSWNRIPGTPIPFPLFPNFMDMRLVR